MKTGQDQTREEETRALPSGGAMSLAGRRCSDSAWPIGPNVNLDVRPPKSSLRLVSESQDGRALVPIPKRSTSPWATSTLSEVDSLKALDLKRPIREADIHEQLQHVGFVPQAVMPPSAQS